MADQTAATQSGQNGQGKFQVPNFVAEIWTGKIMKNLEQERIVMDLVNRDYEGEIKGKGDKVWIYSTGRILTADYKLNDPDGINYEVAESFKMSFEIDQSRYFAFKVEDVEKAQSKPEYVSKLTASAANSLANDTERHVYKTMLDGAAVNDAENYLGKIGGNQFLEDNTVAGKVSGVTVTALAGVDGSTGKGSAIDLRAVPADSIYEAFVDLGVIFDDSELPTAGRYIIVPTFLEAAIRKDPRFIAFGADASNEAKKSGAPIGELNGFKIVKKPSSYFKAPTAATRNVLAKTADDINSPVGALTTARAVYLAGNVGVGAYLASATDTTKPCYKCIAGIEGAVSYAEQFAKTESVRLQESFADGVRGLLLFGSKAMEPQNLFTVLIGTEVTGTPAIKTRVIA